MIFSDWIICRRRRASTLPAHRGAGSSSDARMLAPGYLGRARPTRVLPNLRPSNLLGQEHSRRRLVWNGPECTETKVWWWAHSLYLLTDSSAEPLPACGPIVLERFAVEVTSTTATLPKASVSSRLVPTSCLCRKAPAVTCVRLKYRRGHHGEKQVLSASGRTFQLLQGAFGGPQLYFNPGRSFVSEIAEL